MITLHRRPFLRAGLALLASGIFLNKVAARTDGDALLEELSAVRRRMGLPDLAVDKTLMRAARAQALHMETRALATHFAADGSDPRARGLAVGYVGVVLGEAIAETCGGPAETVALWLSDDATREVLLDPQACEAGVFAAETRAGVIWWDLILGTEGRPHTGPDSAHDLT